MLGNFINKILKLVLEALIKLCNRFLVSFRYSQILPSLDVLWLKELNSFPVYCYNFAWKDYGAATMEKLLDMVKVVTFSVQEGRVAIHCHAGKSMIKHAIPKSIWILKTINYPQYQYYLNTSWHYKQNCNHSKIITFLANLKS